MLFDQLPLESRAILSMYPPKRGSLNTHTRTRTHTHRHRHTDTGTDTQTHTYGIIGSLGKHWHAARHAAQQHQSILKWQEKNQSCFVHDLVAVGVALAMHAVVRVEDERVHELAPRRTGVGASGARPSTRLRKSGPSPRVK